MHYVLTFFFLSVAFAEWYRGIVTDVSADRNTYDVMYDDGETDYDLCRRCVRRFRPFEVGEDVEARIEADVYEHAKILAVSEDDDTCDIRLRSNNHIIEDVPLLDLRRFR